MAGTELETRKPEAPTVAFDPDSELQVWARDLTTAYQAARQLVTTSFVPKTYSGKPEEAAAAIMTGQELGLSPLAALRSIDIIGGVPAMRAVALRALVQSKGHEIWVEESTKTQAVVAGRRRGADKVERSVWTIDRARDLGLLGKDNWKKQPIAMLLARATSELVRLIAADVILGIPYSVEEVQDQTVTEPDAPVKAPASRTARRKPLPVKPEEPPLPDLSGDALREADQQQAHQMGDEPATASVEPQEPAESVEGEPVFDDALAQQIEAQVAAERQAAFDEPALDGVWDETQGSK
jgi:hypothetical protein